MNVKKWLFLSITYFQNGCRLEPLPQKTKIASSAVIIITVATKINWQEVFIVPKTCLQRLFQEGINIVILLHFEYLCVG